jgi:hypothetical protein
MQKIWGHLFQPPGFQMPFLYVKNTAIFSMRFFSGTHACLRVIIQKRTLLSRTQDSMIC